MKINLLIAFLLVATSSVYAVEGKTILYVGDSHSYGKLGTVIEKNLSAQFDRVIIQSSCGATPSTWLGNNKYEKTVCGYWKKDGQEEIRSKEHNTPKLKDELAKYRPDITIVQLGTNIAAGSKPSNAKSSIIEVMKAIHNEGSKCIWIGPPDANSKIVTKEKLIETNSLLKTTALENNCEYIDSLQLTTFPLDNKEGIHYPPGLSSQWGEKISTLLLLKVKSQ